MLYVMTIREILSENMLTFVDLWAFWQMETKKDFIQRIKHLT